MNEYAKDVAEWLRKIASHVEAGKITSFDDLKWDGGDTCHGKLSLFEKVQFTHITTEAPEEKKP